MSSLQKPSMILASTSVYRKELLLKLGMPFSCEKPKFNEDSAKLQNNHLAPADLCLFLGEEKAKSLSTDQNCVIGGDQMAVLTGDRLDKPGSFEKAKIQLEKMQGKTHELLTAVTVIFKGNKKSFLDRTLLKMRPLTGAEIEKYLLRDEPFDCAGSYKIEKHGISLFDSIQTEDFTAIQGLPLLKLAKILREFGY
jgi:septum formation protein